MMKIKQKTLAIITVVIIAAAILMFYHQNQTPIISHVTYHVGDSIGNTGYVFSGLEGTGVGSNMVYALFSPSDTSISGGIQHNVADGVPFTIGNSSYVIVSSGSSSGVDYIVMQKVTL